MNHLTRENNTIKTGVLISNLGTPDSTDITAVKKFLAEFLSDPRVIKLPKPFWQIILNCFILPFRPARSAEAYRKIWTPDGSPLLVLCKHLVNAVQKEMDLQNQDRYQLELGMRYGNPSIHHALEKLKKAKINQVIIFPLYPQYSETTTESTFDAVNKSLEKLAWQPALVKIRSYYDHPLYIKAIAHSILQHEKIHGKPEQLVFSFHGIPEQYADAGDPYPKHCDQTVKAVTEYLDIPDSDWIQTYQSRFGPKKWLQPYTDITLKTSGQQGIKNVAVISPGFSVDCLETLEEINIQNRSFFIDAGGEEFFYIPCLNDQVDHVHLLSSIILEQDKNFS